LRGFDEHANVAPIALTAKDVQVAALKAAKLNPAMTTEGHRRGGSSA